MEKVAFTAAGDFLAQRKRYEPYEGMEAVKEFIGRGDFRFCNLETTFPDASCFGNQYYGGSHLRADKSVLEDVKAFGFNVLSFANNHTMDYDHDGLRCTLEAVNEAGFVHAGAGLNLDEAAAPGYLETKNAGIALIAAVSTLMNPAAMAGRQSRRVLGRPGVNGLRVDEKIVVTKEELETIRQIIDRTTVNAQADISRAEGFTPPLPEGSFPVKTVLFEAGEQTKYVTHPNKTDMDRILGAIREARHVSNYVIISMHSHEVGGRSKEIPGDFYVEFAHRCIDAGAHAVIGHGPHLLRPVEIYHGRPIFYSMGNFYFQEEMTAFAPEDMYEKYHLTSDAGMEGLYRTRTKNFTRGLMEDKRVFEAVVPYFEMEGETLTRLELLPISLGFTECRCRRGLPRVGTHQGILERLAEMSRPYGTRIDIGEDGIGRACLEKEVDA